MLKKIYRLPSYQRLRGATFLKTSDFLLKFSKNNEDVSRFGFVVRKSVDKRAVVRNKSRRVLRSCIEEMLGNIKAGYDMIFFIEKGIIEKNHEDICPDLKNLLSQHRLLK